MKVNLLNNNFSHVMLAKPKSGYLGEHTEDGSVCEITDKSVNRGYYGGSFMGREKAAANFLKDFRKEFGNHTFNILDRASDWCHSQTSIMQAFIAMLVAVGPRPAAIMILPGKSNKRSDKAAAATHAICSGIVGFGFASIVMYPIGKAAKKIYNPSAKDGEYVGDAIIIKEKLQKCLDGAGKNIKDLTSADLDALNITQESLLKNTKLVGEKFLRLFGEFKDGKMIKINKNLNIDKVSKFLNMAPDTFVFGVIKAILTVALIPPIMKHVFGIDRTKSAEKNEQASENKTKEVK